MHATPTGGANELIGSKVVPRQSVGLLSVAGSKAGQGVRGGSAADDNFPFPRIDNECPCVQLCQ